MERTDTDRVPHLTDLENTATTAPGAVALIDETGTTTYSQLIADISQRASQLTTAGLRPGDRVALVAENSSAFVASAFAVWSAGGVLATIYPSSAAGDLTTMLDFAAPVLVLADHRTHHTVREAADGLGAPVVVIDQGTFTVERVGTSDISTPTDLREPLAMICFSSGSTAAPKAIMLSATALHNGGRTYADVWHLCADDVTLVCLPMAWMWALNSTLATLVAGGTVVAMRRARPELLVDAIAAHRATFLPAVTTVFAKLVQHLDATGEQADLSSLRLAISAGEPRNERTFARFTELTGVGVLDSYCASELYPLVTYDPTQNPMPVPGSAGKVVPRSELRVVDADGVDVPAGGVGEGLSRGAGMMLGYWRDAEQTRTALTEDGWYRTKDLIRVDADGFVYVVGRTSDVILRGGSNVSPAEVATVLRDHPDVRDALVVGIPDEIYGEEVAAAIVAASGSTIDPRGLRAHAAERLAPFKVPTKFVILDELPLNNTGGKVDRRAVADLVAAGEGV